MSKPATDVTGAVYKAYGGKELSHPLWTKLCTGFLNLTGNAGFIRAVVFNKIHDFAVDRIEKKR